DGRARAIAREIVRGLAPPPPPPWHRRDPEPPSLDPGQLHGIPSTDPRHPFDAREVIGRVVDGSRLQEFKALYGDTLVCGFAHLHGHPIAVLANNGILFSESALKGAHFV